MNFCFIIWGKNYYTCREGKIKLEMAEYEAPDKKLSWLKIGTEYRKLEPKEHEGIKLEYNGNYSRVRGL